MFQIHFFAVPKNFYLHLFLLIVCSLWGLNVNAAAIGMPKSTIELGLGSTLTRASVNDSEGRTQNITKTAPTSFYLTDWFNQGTRYLAEIYTSSYAFKADVDHLGAQVTQTGLRLSFQVNTPIGKYFSPWLGAGVDSAFSQFRKRHEVDDEGYLTRQYDDKKSIALGLLFNVMEKWNINSYMDIAAKVEYVAPITQSVNGFSAGVIFLFRPKF